ncbi:MAG: DsbA family oxidoreductase, partial [Actinomycetota bacterium]|nr:DsbA family oxidoreductase [Actinomycetota bacterium]
AAGVRTDERRAAELGITSVPFFVMAGLGVSGAQPTEVLLQVLEDAWAETTAQSS